MNSHTNSLCSIFCRYLVDWLRKHQIVKGLFDPATTHPEILGHASDVVGFLATNNSLSKEDMECIWQLTSDQHLFKPALEALDCTGDFPPSFFSAQ
jgi:hypothetical protein